MSTERMRFSLTVRAERRQDRPLSAASILVQLDRRCGVGVLLWLTGRSRSSTVDIFSPEHKANFYLFYASPDGGAGIPYDSTGRAKGLGH
jgi:hypothetical protein